MVNVKNCNGGGGTLSSTPVSSEMDTQSRANSLAPCRESKPSRGQDLSPRPFVGEGVRRTGEGSHSDKIAQQVRNDSASSVNNQKIGGKAAFTLAEVLITLGIIGVVAAMTLPSLIQNYQKKALATQTQKFYSTMSQAVKQYMADYGVDDLRNTPLASDNYGEGSWDDDGNYIPANGEIESIRDFVTKYLKVIQECDHDANDCFAPEYQLFDGHKPDGEFLYNFTDVANHESRRDYVLADGSVIRIGYHWFNEPIILFVDVNGKKGPNRVGYDLWNMDIFYDGVIDESGVGPECRGRIEAEYNTDDLKCEQTSAHEKREYKFEDICKDGQYGGCFGHFLNNNFKFDY